MHHRTTLRVPSIKFEGGDLIPRRAEERAKLGIGYVPQGREIFPYLTVEENLRIGIGVRKNGVKSIPERIFDLFPVLKKMLSRRGRLVRRAAAALAIGRALVLEIRLTDS